MIVFVWMYGSVEAVDEENEVRRQQWSTGTY